MMVVWPVVQHSFDDSVAPPATATGPCVNGRVLLCAHDSCVTLLIVRHRTWARLSKQCCRSPVARQEYDVGRLMSSQQTRLCSRSTRPPSSDGQKRIRFTRRVVGGDVTPALAARLRDGVRLGEVD